MDIVFNTREPVYLQVVNHFKIQIANGKLKAGDEIPSRRELAQQLKINPNTVQKAYKEMEEQKLIQTIRNFPSTITEDEDVLKQVKNELIQEAVSTFITSIEKIQLPVEEIIEIVKEKYTEVLKQGEEK